MSVKEKIGADPRGSTGNRHRAILRGDVLRLENSNLAEENHRMEVGFLIALVGATVWFSALLVAARMRWFSRFKRGFRLTLSVSLISLAVWSSLLIAYWGYSSARKALLNDTDANLNNLGKVVEQAIDNALTD